MSLFLITTADERSWRFDIPVLFLGEWCRRYDRRHVWQRMNAAVAEPFGLQLAQRDRNFAYIESLSRRLLAELVDVLNEFHGTRHNLRYWQIVLGHWLQRYVTLIYNRYFTLEQTLATHGALETSTFEAHDYSLATSDSLGFIWACSNDEWNHVLYKNILRFLGGVKIEVDKVPLRGVYGFKQVDATLPGRILGAKRLALNVANYVLPKLSKKRDAFIVHSYLPLREEINLQLRLGQCPQLWRSPALQEFSPDVLARQAFSVEAGNATGFERFARTQLGSMIPTCYLEGYAKLVRQVETLPWPSQPRHIFTSNNFDHDEVFKVWAGLKVEQGTPYFTGQHGNNYGTHVFYGNASLPERSAADQFITWGDWSGDERGTSSAFLFKTAGKKPRQIDPDGGLLLVEFTLQHRLLASDMHHQHHLYQEAQFCFVAHLPAAIHSRLTVRLHGLFRHGSWCDDQRWKDRSPETRVERGVLPIQKLIKQSRLVVHSYDSTGTLETLALNIPTLCFWWDGLDHVLPAMRPYYEMLRSAGILIESPEQAAAFVASYWDRIGEWWGSAKVQHARRAFCQQFARTDKTPASTLSRLLCRLEAEHGSVRVH
jgi:putative transferase (TIGR04331 family)